MRTERLEEFRMLAQIQNYSRTAERLFISQSILSRHIKELEQELGVTLFFRDTHGVALTDEGKYLLKWAEPFLEKTDRVLSALTGSREGAEGNVRIFYSEQVLNTAVLTFIHSFMETYPTISLEFIPQFQMFKREQFYSTDITLSPCDYLDTLLSDIQGTLLTMQEPLLAIPPYHHLGDQQQIHLEDLKGESLIVPFADDLFGPFAQNALCVNRYCHGDIRRISAENPTAALLQVELGQGVMLILHHFIYRVYPHTRTIPVADPECRFPILAYRNCLVDNPAARLFYEKMNEEFNGAT